MFSRDRSFTVKRFLNLQPSIFVTERGKGHSHKAPNGTEIGGETEVEIEIGKEGIRSAVLFAFENNDTD